MQVRKAVITAAAPDQSRLPLQQLIDAQGRERTALALIIDEATSAGIEEIAVIIRPEDASAYESAAESTSVDLHFIKQAKPTGYAAALTLASDFIGSENFLHLVGDHLYVESTNQTCAKQLINVAAEFGCSVSAVQATRETNLPYFGIVSGPRVPQLDRVFEIETVLEKPTPTKAEQHLITPGLRSGQYLGFFGMHVLTPEVMSLLKDLSNAPESKPASLSDALAQLPGRQRYLAYQLRGSRYNLGVDYGLLRAQLAIGLSGRDRDLILTELVDLLAGRLEGTHQS
ncbi:MAG: sugar phosphate nucleotidyltransferase [Planctomycetota bacterium]